MPRVYIHEVVEVDGTRRADYQHHMTANWVPESAAVRRQRCFGVFTLVGSTGPWPRVVNLWEYDSWEDLAHNFSHELGTPGHRDPALARWWAAAASFRKGGHDRILVEHPSNPGVQHWESRGGTAAAAYLHEVFTTPVGGALRLAEELAGGAVEAMSRWAIEPVGLWHTAMRGDDEVVALWRVPDWDSTRRSQRLGRRLPARRDHGQAALVAGGRAALAAAHGPPTHRGGPPPTVPRVATRGSDRRPGALSAGGCPSSPCTGA